MKQWFFDNIESFQPNVGFQTSFLVTNEGRNFNHLWTITDVVPNERITYNWKYQGYAGDSNVTFEIIELDSQVLLKLTHEIVEHFQQDIPEFNRESCVGGWNYFIKERLVNYLNWG